MAPTTLQASPKGSSRKPGLHDAAVIIRENLDPSLLLLRRSLQFQDLMRMMRNHPDDAMRFASRIRLDPKDVRCAALQVAAILLDCGKLEKASALAHLAKLDLSSTVSIKPKVLPLLDMEVKRGEILKAANMSLPFRLTRKDTAPFRAASIRWLESAPLPLLVNAGSAIPIAFHLTASETSRLKPNAIRGLRELLREDATRPIGDSNILLLLAATGAYCLHREDLTDLISPARGRIRGFLATGNTEEALSVAAAFGITGDELLLDITEVNTRIRQDEMTGGKLR